MKTYLKIIFTAVITAIITFSITSVFFTVRQMDVTANSSSKSLGRKIETVNTYLENNYLYDNVDYKKANDNAVKAYVESLEEPYTHYYTEDEFETYMSRVEESYVGIGVIISADTENDKIVVVSPLKDSPAYKAGIKPGDFITEVDGTGFDASGMDACVAAIKNGKEGDRVKITIERDGDIKAYDIERTEIVERSE